MLTQFSRRILSRKLLVSFLFLLLVLPLFYLIGISRQSNIYLIGHFFHEKSGHNLKTKNVVKSPEQLYYFNGKDSKALTKGLGKLRDKIFSISFWVKFENLKHPNPLILYSKAFFLIVKQFWLC